MRKPLVIAAVLVLLALLSACHGQESPSTPAPPPVASFRFLADGLTVTFVNTSQNAVRYRWDFGDGLVSARPSPSYTYRRAGRYIVRLEAWNVAGTSDSVEVPIDVEDPTV